MIAIALPNLLRGRFPDPDDVLRLVQVRDLLAGQSWFDTTQYRIGPLGSAPMHWSRLVDLPLLIVIGALTPILGQGLAEQVALIAVPLLTLGIALWFVGRIAWRLMGPQVAIYACLACGFMPTLLFQFQPMRIDHHGWQIVTVILTVWGLSWREPHRGGLIAGAAIAAGMIISIELLPIAAAVGLILFLRWWYDGCRRWWLVAYLQGLALTLVILYFATHGTRDLTQYCDAIAPAHLGFLLVTALGTGSVAWFAKATRFGLLLLLGAVGIAGLAFFFPSAPQCIATPFGSLDPLVHDLWYVHVMEGQPFWLQPPSEAVPSMIQLLVGLAASVTLWSRSFGWMREWWREYSILLVAAIGLSLFVWRSAAFASILAAIPLGWLLSRLLHTFRNGPHTVVRVAAVALIVLLLVPSTLIPIHRLLVPDAPAAQVSQVAVSACEIRVQAAKLDAIPAGRIFAPLDIGPAILANSHHAVVATGHHRAAPAMHDVIAAFTGSPQQAHKLVSKYDADYLVFCSDLTEAQLFARAAPQGLMAELNAGNTPAWLEPVAFDGPDEFVIYRVKE